MNIEEMKAKLSQLQKPITEDEQLIEDYKSYFYLEAVKSKMRKANMSEAIISQISTIEELDEIVKPTDKMRIVNV